MKYIICNRKWRATCWLLGLNLGCQVWCQEHYRHTKRPKSVGFVRYHSYIPGTRLHHSTLKKKNLFYFLYVQWPLCTHLAASSWSITCAISDRNCMKYCITKLWFRFNGKSSSSTFTTAFNKSKNWGTFSLFLATRVIIFCTWIPLIFMQVLELPVNTWKSNTRFILLKWMRNQ